MWNQKLALTAAVLATASLLPTPLFAWGASHSGSYSGSRGSYSHSGSSSGGWGEASHSSSGSGSGAYGGSVSHSSSTSGGYGDVSHSGSTSYTSPSGQSYSGSHSGSGSYGYGGATYHGSYSGTGGSASYYGYHGASYTTTSSGCYGSGFGAGVVTGAAVGATVGAAVAASAAPTTVYVNPTPGVYVQPTQVVTTAAPVATLPIGTTLTVLPVGFTSLNVNGVQYYQSGPTWYRMNVGSTGTTFVVVAPP